MSTEVENRSTDIGYITEMYFLGLEFFSSPLYTIFFTFYSRKVAKLFQNYEYAYILKVTFNYFRFTNLLLLTRDFLKKLYYY